MGIDVFFRGSIFKMQKLLTVIFYSSDKKKIFLHV